MPSRLHGPAGLRPGALALRWLTPLPLLLALFLLAGCPESSSPEFELSKVTGRMPDLEFRMEDARGQVRTQADFQEKVVLLYFGYTQCPDICPMTLGRIRRALSRLPDEKASDVAVLFVTVDPERDTPKVMRQYVDQFRMPQLTGLVGSGKGFKALKERYHIFAKLQKEGPDDTDYAVTHSNRVLVFDRQGRARVTARLSGKEPDSIKALIKDLRTLL